VDASTAALYCLLAAEHVYTVVVLDKIVVVQPTKDEESKSKIVTTYECFTKSSVKIKKIKKVLH
jgi:exosome complex RNA-binding protein Rrp42 (RNase PH superfamily)